MYASRYYCNNLFNLNVKIVECSIDDVHHTPKSSFNISTWVCVRVYECVFLCGRDCVHVHVCVCMHAATRMLEGNFMLYWWCAPYTLIVLYGIHPELTLKFSVPTWGYLQGCIRFMVHTWVCMRVYQCVFMYGHVFMFMCVCVCMSATSRMLQLLEGYFMPCAPYT